jgi:hypothetical protein
VGKGRKGGREGGGKEEGTEGQCVGEGEEEEPSRLTGRKGDIFPITPSSFLSTSGLGTHLLPF